MRRTGAQTHHSRSEKSSTKWSMVNILKNTIAAQVMPSNDTHWSMHLRPRAKGKAELAAAAASTVAKRGWGRTAQQTCTQVAPRGCRLCHHSG